MKEEPSAAAWPQRVLVGFRVYTYHESDQHWKQKQGLCFPVIKISQTFGYFLILKNKKKKTKIIIYIF